MNISKLTITVVAVAFLALAAVVFWQHGQARRLTADAAILREQLAEAAGLRADNERLAGQLRIAAERAQSDASELARLRGQTARMRQIEQENSRLMTERNRAITPSMPAAHRIRDDQTPEWALAEARMRFSKVLGLSICAFAQNHDGQMPTNTLAAIASQSETDLAEMLADQLPPAATAHDIQLDQYELVFQGNLKATGRQPGTTMIARTKEAFQFSNGRWARPCVFDDGSGIVLVADTLDALAAQEQKLIQRP